MATGESSASIASPAFAHSPSATLHRATGRQALCHLPRLSEGRRSGLVNARSHALHTTSDEYTSVPERGGRVGGRGKERAVGDSATMQLAQPRDYVGVRSPGPRRSERRKPSGFKRSATNPLQRHERSRTIERNESRCGCDITSRCRLEDARLYSWERVARSQSPDRGAKLDPRSARCARARSWEGAAQGMSAQCHHAALVVLSTPQLPHAASEVLIRCYY